MKNVVKKKILKSGAVSAFTLAEVLITLSIIGVVAVLTIPPVIVSYQERANISKLKKVYVELEEAFKMAQIKKGSVTRWNLEEEASSVGADTLLENFAPYLNVAKTCRTGEIGCFKDIYVKNLTDENSRDNYGNGTETFSTAKLSNGASLAFYSRSQGCKEQTGENDALKNTCAEIKVDVNGFDGPNKFGVDSFGFLMTKYGIVPMGVKEVAGENAAAFSIDVNCNHTGSEDEMNWQACTAWVILKDNMDYLRRQVSWDEQ